MTFTDFTLQFFLIGYSAGARAFKIKGPNLKVGRAKVFYWF